MYLVYLVYLVFLVLPMKIRMSTRQAGGVPIVDISGQIVLGEESTWRKRFGLEAVIGGVYV